MPCETATREHAGTRPNLPDPQAVDFHHLFDQHFAYLCRAMRRLGVHPGDVEDEVQNAFIAVYRHLDQYEPSRPVKPWLYGFAVRTASNYRRGARRFADAMVKAVDADQLWDDGMEDTAHARQFAARTLGELPFALRSVLVMHDVEGIGASDIAETLSIPVTTVYARLRRARTEFSVEVERLAAQSAPGSESDALADRTDKSKQRTWAAMLAVVAPPIMPSDIDRPLPTSATVTGAGDQAPPAPSTHLSGAGYKIGRLLQAGQTAQGIRALASAAAVGFGLGGVAAGTLVHAAHTSAQTVLTAAIPCGPDIILSLKTQPTAPIRSEGPAQTLDESPAIEADALPIAPIPTVGLPSRGANPAGGVRVLAPAAKEPRQASTITRERELIDMAAAALARGRPSQALQALGNHAKQFPHGQMAPERETLIERARRMHSDAALDDGGPTAPAY